MRAATKTGTRASRSRSRANIGKALPEPIQVKINVTRRGLQRASSVLTCLAIASDEGTCQGGRDNCVHSCGDSREANITHEPAREAACTHKGGTLVTNSLEREALTGESVSADAKGCHGCSD